MNARKWQFHEFSNALARVVDGKRLVQAFVDPIRFIRQIRIKYIEAPYLSLVAGKVLLIVLGILGGEMFHTLARAGVDEIIVACRDEAGDHRRDPGGRGVHRDLS